MNVSGLLLLVPTRHGDTRGFFAETYSRRVYKEYGILDEFVQDNHSISREVETLRGLHFQAPPNAQAKLVRCGRGAIFDVAVDIRRGSPTYGKWKGYTLTAENGHQLYIPVGFAHGFVVLSDTADFMYKTTDYYAPQYERSILWNDIDLNIDWHLGDITPSLSDKDKEGVSFKNAEYYD